MTQSREEAFACTAVIQRVLSHGLGEAVPRRSANCRNPKVGAESLAISFRALLPFWGSVLGLSNTCSDCRAHNWIGPENIKKVVAPLGFFCWTSVSLTGLLRRVFRPGRTRCIGR